jgi:hypothetical protein
MTAYLALSWVFLLVVSGVMGLAVAIFTGYTLYLLVNNKTTLEAMEPVRYRTAVAASDFRYREAPSSETVGNIFDLGWKANWRQIMGNRPWEWILPVVP